MNYKIPKNLYYTAEHEWVRIEEDIATIGITDFAQSSLGDIVFVELPQVESKFELGAPFGVVESIKSVSDLFCPLNGEVIDVNRDLEEKPELCNSDPYDAWMIKIKIISKKEISQLISSDKYPDYCNES
ncbi:MAG: glycine cleavage system protein GcvH [Halobacteriovoraceae bacterium]|nr:glycine cleavage system protein GcvH [Halobacteriovoraceae bacterium]